MTVRAYINDEEWYPVLTLNVTDENTIPSYGDEIVDVSDELWAKYQQVMNDMEELQTILRSMDRRFTA